MSKDTTKPTQYEKLGNGLTRAINPARRAKKATGLSGRQWVKYRKAQRRAQKIAA